MGRPEDGEGGTLDDVLTWNVVRVARFVGSRLADRLAGHRLHPIHFGVLAFLAGVPEMTSSEIARAVLVRPQSIAPLLDGLEERGLTRRTGTRARGRRNPVQITDAGRQALDDVWGIALSSNDLSDAGLTQQESGELNRLLLKIVHATHDAQQHHADRHTPSTTRARQGSAGPREST